MIDDYTKGYYEKGKIEGWNEALQKARKQIGKEMVKFSSIITDNPDDAMISTANINGLNKASEILEALRRKTE